MPARSGPSPRDASTGSRPLPQIAALLVVAALVATGLVVVLQPLGAAVTAGPSTFESRDELAAFLEARDARGERHHGGAVADMALSSASAADAAPGGSSDAASDHSETNVQVEGVDEADFVKSDGQHIYVVTGDRVRVVRAYPPSQAHVVGDVPLPDGRPEGLYLDGDRLVVMGASDDPPPFVEGETVILDGDGPRRPGPSLPSTYVRVVDVTDPADPTVERDVTVHGRLHDSRMIDDHVYVVLDVPLRFDDDDEPVVPVVNPGQEGFPEIHHFDGDGRVYQYTNVLSVPVRGEEPVDNEAYLLERATNLYASQTNLYLATPHSTSDDGPAEPWARAEATLIHKLALDDGSVSYQASGQVPGRILNQFSMDEHDGHLRVATTVGHVSRSLRGGEVSSTNNVYILDGEMKTVGELEGVAPNERIYSARFMGDRAYLVTFKKVDPFFVLDLSDPTAPEVLGELKLPGYSDYLHPFGEDHVIGIGKDTVEAESGDFAWYQGVRVNLFDASDVEDPELLDAMVLGDRGSESEVLRDHKAFLLDRERGFMAFPLLWAEVDESRHDGEPRPNAHGHPVWQGAYVMDVSIEDGLSVRGQVTHVDGSLDGGHYSRHRSDFVRRSLTMDDTLYTISEQTIAANALDDLAERARVDIG